jgi:hypothetical protein
MSAFTEAIDLLEEQDSEDEGEEGEEQVIKWTPLADRLPRSTIARVSERHTQWRICLKVEVGPRSRSFDHNQSHPFLRLFSTFHMSHVVRWLASFHL